MTSFFTKHWEKPLFFPGLLYSCKRVSKNPSCRQGRIESFCQPQTWVVKSYNKAQNSVEYCKSCKIQPHTSPDSDHQHQISWAVQYAPAFHLLNSLCLLVIFCVMCMIFSLLFFFMTYYPGRSLSRCHDTNMIILYQ